jgi:hypothetical protein
MQPPPPRIRFRPVPVKARHDGWTPARQAHFIDVLAATKSVVRACAAVGKSREAAYKLLDRSRGNPEQQDFARAWNDALKPDFAKERRRSPRAEARLRRLARAAPKVDEVHEIHAPPDSLARLDQHRHFWELRQLLLAGGAQASEKA